mgnify:CR=1 FL=1
MTTVRDNNAAGFMLWCRRRWPPRQDGEDRTRERQYFHVFTCTDSTDCKCMHAEFVGIGSARTAVRFSQGKIPGREAYPRP